MATRKVPDKPAKGCTLTPVNSIATDVPGGHILEDPAFHVSTTRVWHSSQLTMHSWPSAGGREMVHSCFGEEETVGPASETNSNPAGNSTSTCPEGSKGEDVVSENPIFVSSPARASSRAKPATESNAGRISSPGISDNCSTIKLSVSRRPSPVLQHRSWWVQNTEVIKQV